MTTLTPHRKALEEALDGVKASLPPYDPVNLEAVTRHMTLDLQRAMLMPVADMFDRRVNEADVTHVMANSISNAILSHAMSLSGGDKGSAAPEAFDLLRQIGRILALSFEVPNLSEHVVSSSPIPPTGRA